jgi:hypothetical protein
MTRQAAIRFIERKGYKLHFVEKRKEYIAYLEHGRNDTVYNAKTLNSMVNVIKYFNGRSAEKVKEEINKKYAANESDDLPF